MIHSTSRPSYRFDSRDQPHNLQGPEKKENAKPFVKNSLRITWWQKSIKPSMKPFQLGAPCDCTGHTPTKSEWPTAFSLVGFHCLNCFLSACPASGTWAQNWVSLFTKAHKPLGASLPHFVGTTGSLLWGGRERLSAWVWEVPLGKVSSSIAQLLRSFSKRTQCRSHCVSHCAKLWVFKQ